MSDSGFLSKTTGRVLAWFTVIATVAAIVGGMMALDNRYARAEDVKKTQAEIFKSIKMLNVGVELTQLENRLYKLKGEKREIVRRMQAEPKNILLQEQLSDVKDDLYRVNIKIGHLENMKIEDE